MKIRVTEMPKCPKECLFAYVNFFMDNYYVSCTLGNEHKPCLNVSECEYLDDGKEKEK